jgi:hypothetical protein
MPLENKRKTEKLVKRNFPKGNRKPKKGIRIRIRGGRGLERGGGCKII